MTITPVSTPTGRRLVVCLDGTWNSTANESLRETGDRVLRPTNTLKICRAVLPIADKPQLTYYDIGVGSLARYPGTANRILYRADKVLGGAWGAGFEANVESALDFLANNYLPGDEVYIFGFSRGAATARAVTRFLEWSGGLLPKRDAYYLPIFFRHYIESQGKEDELKKLLDARNTKRAAHKDPGNRYPIVFHPVDVRYLGVWDTVASLGSRLEAARGDTTSVAGRAFHAGKAPAPCVRHARQALAVDEKRFDFRPEIWTESRPGQTMQQRWFAGVHSNIGGGLDPDGLANIALEWIVQGAESEGLKLDRNYLAPFRQHIESPVSPSWTLKYKIFESVFLNLGKGKRTIAGANSDLHESVIEKLRLDSTYRPENVLQFLACQPSLTAYGELPADVQKRIDELRPNCNQ